MITIEIDEKNEKANELLKLLRSYDFVKFTNDELIPNQETIEAIEDARNGKLNRYKSSKEMFDELKKRANV